MVSRPTTSATLLLILAIVALGLAPSLHAQQTTSHTLVYAVYEGERTAGDAGAAPISTDVLDSLRVSLTPGSSAVIAVMNDRWARDVQRDLKAARARASMASVITQETENASP
jgi:hypothetical protein